jgi:hypothetical protein
MTTMQTAQVTFAAITVAVVRACTPLVDDEETQDDVRRTTLACNFEFADTLDLATGEVTRLALADQAEGADLTCAMGRRIGLRATPTPETCQADAVYTGVSEPARYDDVNDIGDSCTLDGIWCSYLGAGGYEPVCASVGGVFVDKQGTPYALRVVSDSATLEDGAYVIAEFVVEYAPLSAR